MVGLSKSGDQSVEMRGKTESCWLELGKKSKCAVNNVLVKIEKVLVLLYYGGKLLN